MVVGDQTGKVRYIENKQTYGKVVISIRPEQNLAKF
jgi:hypothetical protein